MNDLKKISNINEEDDCYYNSGVEQIRLSSYCENEMKRSPQKLPPLQNGNC